MLFNSIQFAIFLPTVFFLYWFVFGKNFKVQNAFILFVSYIFYGYWDWRFLLLIAFTSFCSWWSGLLIQRAVRANLKRRATFICGVNIVLNLAILGAFKYYNFFVSQFVNAFFGGGSEVWLISIILPVGISFYTFQALSYSIDVYRSDIKATPDIIQFFTYVAFFPQLVAGPIERATNLLIQFESPRSFDYARAVDGMRQMLWGFFKKMIIADNCAKVVDAVWADYSVVDGSTLALAAVFFALQIYGDFSGYSDIAIGSARLFGININRNFHFPYFSRDIAEFWRRWHISLNTWFRDYLYIPLGGSRGTKLSCVRNVLIIFTVSGLWHGANWTFLFWGLFHGLLFVPILLAGKNRKYIDIVAVDRFLPSIHELFSMIATFILVNFGWILFRAPTITDAWRFIERMLFSGTFFTMPQSGVYVLAGGISVYFFVVVLFIFEWLGRRGEHALEFVDYALKPRILRWGLYLIICVAIVQYNGGAARFIYFQF